MLYLSPECLFNFLSNLNLFHHEWEKFWNSWCSHSWKIHLIWAFLLMFLPTQNSPPSSYDHTLGRRNLFIPQAVLFRKSVSPKSRNRWRKLSFALSKFNQKIWRRLGTLGHLYFVWFVIFWLYSFVNNIYHIEWYWFYYLSFATIIIWY